MKPGKFVESVLNVPICAELKQHIDSLYSLYEKDPENFKMHYRPQRGLAKLDILIVLPTMFQLIKEGDIKNEINGFRRDEEERMGPV